MPTIPTEVLGLAGRFRQKVSWACARNGLEPGDESAEPHARTAAALPGHGHGRGRGRGRAANRVAQVTACRHDHV